jgi:hypothetical protein
MISREVLNGSAVQRAHITRRGAVAHVRESHQEKLPNFLLCSRWLDFFLAILKEGYGAGPIAAAEGYNLLSAAIQIRPLSRLNERRPVERMMPILAPQHSQLHLPEAFAASLSAPERIVIWDHDIFSPLV